MRIKLYCLNCGHATFLDEAYEDYRGELRCWGCRAVIEVAIEQGKLKAMRCVGPGAPVAARAQEAAAAPVLEEAS
ncbi:MAG: hypothetical protein HY744_22715 [Deltaproteobacteria bacterium]|nr:hypothetical protein [Deltaproteobacteria bacterium]